MPIAQFTDALRTGDPVVDRQHQELFRLVNELHDGLLAGRKQELLGPTLARLGRYTVDHFATEEKLMAATGYPGYLAHKAKHDALAKKATEIIQGYNSGKLVLTLTLSQFLADWVRGHILAEDLAMVAFLHSRVQGHAASP